MATPYSHAGLWKVAKRGRSMRKLADGGGEMDYIGQWWPFSRLGDGGGFIRALLGGEVRLDWMALTPVEGDLTRLVSTSA
jgi:hypothetical protein